MEINCIRLGGITMEEKKLTGFTSLLHKLIATLLYYKKRIELIFGKEKEVFSFLDLPTCRLQRIERIHRVSRRERLPWKARATHLSWHRSREDACAQNRTCCPERASLRACWPLGTWRSMVESLLGTRRTCQYRRIRPPGIQSLRPFIIEKERERGL